MALGFGMTAAQILAFYDELGPTVFSCGWLTSWWNRLSSKYDPSPLRRALEKHFGNRLLGESRKRLIMPSLNLETDEVHLFMASHHPHLEIDHKARAVDAGLATAAAPTCSPSHVLGSGVPLVDGGVWANSPVAVAALGLLDWPKDGIRILSLGCTSAPCDADKARPRPTGKLYWASRIADLFMTEETSSALGMAQHLVSKSGILRVSPVMPKGR